MKLSADRARGSMRFSFGRYNTEAEVDKAIEILPTVIAKLRSLSSPAAVREPAGV